MRWLSSRSLFVQLSAGIGSVVLLGLIGYASLILIVNTSFAMDDLREDLSTIAELTADDINQDPLTRAHYADLTQLVTQVDADHDPRDFRIYQDWRYEDVQYILSRVAASNPEIDAIYTMAPTDDPLIFQFVVTADEDPETLARFGSSYSIEEFPRMGDAMFRGVTICDDEAAGDRFGIWFSCYAPLFAGGDPQGKVIGIVGVDVFASDVRAMQYSIMTSSLVALVVIMSAMFGMILGVVWLLTRRLRAITTVAQQISAVLDNEEALKQKSEQREEVVDPQLLELATRGDDPIGQLGRLLERLARDVRRRVETLTTQIRRLQIEIDDAKKQRQVEEIVDSDYFKNLQGKVRNLRQRKRQRDATGSGSAHEQNNTEAEEETDQATTPNPSPDAAIN
jgi:hypothetical protein